VLAVAILGALTQREIRDFGTAAAVPAEPQAPTPDPARSARSSAR
jgi:hypothetical protein